jgi:hypothetical protein
LWSATAVLEARSDFEPATALSAAVAACDGPAKHTKSPVATINAERPLALIVIGNLPMCQPPDGGKKPRGVSAAGQKKGIFGLHRAKAGQRHNAGRAAPDVSVSGSLGLDAADVSRTDQCYELAGPEFLVAISLCGV